MSKTVFLGVEGSGKTTLTMALAQAFDKHKSEGWYLKPLSRDSFRFLKTLPDTLDGNFPSQTADLRELRWQAEYKGNDLGEIAILDYPGEIYRLVFLDEKDERDPESFRQKVASNKTEIDALLGAITEAEDIFVLFNLADGLDLRGNPRNLDAVWVTNECLKLLKRLDSKPRIRILFTQVDRYRDAGLGLASFSPKAIDLIGHDHPDVPWSFVSITDKPESECGIDGVADLLVADALSKVVTKDLPYDLDNLDIDRLVYRGGCGKISINEEYFRRVDSAIREAETSLARGGWLVEKVLSWSADQTKDWKVLSKAISDLNGASVNVQIPFNALISSWGKDMARRINDRINSLIKQEEAYRSDIRLTCMVCGIIICFIIIIIVMIAALSR